MDYRDWINRRTLPLKWAFAIAVVSALLFGGSYLVDIILIVESPAIGDITDEVGFVWRIFSGGITLLASLVTIREYLNKKGDEDETGQSQGPTRDIYVEGHNNDITIHTVLPDRRRGDRFTESPGDKPMETSEGEPSTDKEKEELEEEN